MLVGAIAEAISFVLLAVFFRSHLARLDEWLRHTADRAGRGPKRVILASGLMTGALCVMLSLVVWPTPRVQDEFSYRFAAATLASGTLSMPSPTAARHFQAEHILVEPTFASKYPPGQASVLAIGTLIGAPIIGVWISTGVMAASVSWMLFGWCPRRWAVLGSALIVLTPGIIGWWGHSYWGGSVAAAGGALVLGAAPRLRERPSWKLTVLLMLGLGILANSRPYEGLVLSLPVGVWLVVTICRRHAIATAVGRFLLPGLLGAGAIIASLLVYNNALTGDPLTLPYALHAEQYGTVPTFLPSPDRPEPATYDVRHVSDFFAGWEVDKARRHESLVGLASQSAQKLGMMLGFYIGPACMLLCMALFVRAPRRSLRVLGRRPSVPACVLALSISGSLLVTWFYPHYLAPACALFGLAVVALLRRANASTSNLAIGPVVLSRAAGLAAVGIAVWWTGLTPDWTDERRAMIDRLNREPGRHLVLVRHGRRYEPHEEWVYNNPDLVGSRIIWAWELDAPSNGTLLEAYPDRRVWLATPHRDDDAQLIEYPRSKIARPERVTRPDIPIRGATLADLNGDGALTVVYSRADRPGLFEPTIAGETSLFSLEGRPASLVCADLDGDGQDELISAMPLLGRVVVLDPVPDRGFRAHTLHDLRQPADLCLDPVARRVLVATRDGVRAISLSLDGPARATRIGDVPATRVACSRDGRIAWINADGSGITILATGLATTTLAPPVRSGVTIGPTDLVFFDDDGDGRDDVATVFEAADSVRIAFAPDFTRTRTVQCGVRPIAADRISSGLLIATRHGHGLNTLAPGDAGTGVATIGPDVWFREKATGLSARGTRYVLPTTDGVWSGSVHADP